VQSHQGITQGNADVDVLAIAQLHGKYCVEVTFIRGGRHSGSHGFFPKVGIELEEAEVLSAFISQHYHKRPAPKEIIISHALDDQNALAELLSEQSGRKVAINDKPRTARLEWLNSAKLNVFERLKRHLAEAGTVQARLDALQQAFDLEEVITRIECFDISHTQGNQTVASCVVMAVKAS